MSSELAVTTKDLGTRLWLLWYRDLINLLDSYVLTYWTQLCMHCYTCTCIATALCSYTAPLQGEAGLPGNLSCLIAGAAHIIIGTSHMYPVISHSGTRKCTVWSLGYTAGMKPRNRQWKRMRRRPETSSCTGVLGCSRATSAFSPLSQLWGDAWCPFCCMVAGIVLCLRNYWDSWSHSSEWWRKGFWGCRNLHQIQQWVLFSLWKC